LDYFSVRVFLGYARSSVSSFYKAIELNPRTPKTNKNKQPAVFKLPPAELYFAFCHVFSIETPGNLVQVN